jgi:hypothetical protein
LTAGVQLSAGAGIFLFTDVSRSALGRTQTPKWVPGSLSLEVKRPGREPDHSSPSSAEVTNVWSYTSAPLIRFMAWYLVKHRDNFTSLAYKRWPFGLTAGSIGLTNSQSEFSVVLLNTCIANRAGRQTDKPCQ